MHVVSSCFFLCLSNLTINHAPLTIRVSYHLLALNERTFSGHLSSLNNFTSCFGFVERARPYRRHFCCRYIFILSNIFYRKDPYILISKFYSCFYVCYWNKQLTQIELVDRFLLMWDFIFVIYVKK